MKENSKLKIVIKIITAESIVIDEINVKKLLSLIICLAY